MFAVYSTGSLCNSIRVVLHTTLVQPPKMNESCTELGFRVGGYLISSADGINYILNIVHTCPYLFLVINNFYKLNPTNIGVSY